MSDPDTRNKVSEKRRRSRQAYDLLDRKGPYAIKIVNPKRGYPYDRNKEKRKDWILDDNEQGDDFNDT